MTQDHWERLKAAWEEASQLSGEELEAFLERLRKEDSSLAERLESLLRSAAIEDSFLEASSTLVPAPEKLPAIGERLGDFEILKEVGRGGAGVVYRARQVSLDRIVALKVLLPHVTHSPEVVERFHREALAIAKLDHPHIVSVVAVDRADENHFFAMRWIEGPDLASEIQAGDAARVLPPRSSPTYITKIVGIVADLADALDHAHRRGIVHRDVKPHNVLLSQSGEALLADFGIARDAAFGTLTRPEQIAGTLQYMSPEQARVASEATVDHRTDIYSLGVVLYELLTRRLPFESADPDTLFYQLRVVDPPAIRKLDSRIPRDLEAICHQAIAKDPRDRYQTAQQFAEDLRLFLSHEAPRHLITQSIWKRARRRFARHRTKVLVAATVIVAVAGATGIQSFLHERRHSARLSIEIVDANLNPLGRSVTGMAKLRPLDPFTGEPAVDPATGRRSDPISLGDVPEDNFYVDPGFYRVIVLFEDKSFSEHTRILRSQEHTLIQAVKRSPEDPGENDMVLVATATIEQPIPEQRTVCPLAGQSIVVERFLIDRFEVSNAQYQTFLREVGTKAGVERPVHWPPDDAWNPEWDNRPVIGVSWEDARAYAEWVGKRLVSHAEWELAARGPGAGRRFPWGDDASQENCICTGIENPPLTPDGEALHAALSPNAANVDHIRDFVRYLEQTADVDSHPQGATPHLPEGKGAHHMYGNVSEWTESPEIKNVGTKQPDVDWESRYIMGGAWDIAPAESDLSEAHANWDVGKQYVSHQVGFRCAKSVDP